MKKWQGKKRKDKEAQKNYYDKHPWCEICLTEGKKSPTLQIHEVVFRSHGGKCEEDNMVSTCLDCHRRCHFTKTPFLTRKILWGIKGLNIEEMQEKLRNIKKSKL